MRMIIDRYFDQVCGAVAEGAGRHWECEGEVLPFVIRWRRRADRELTCNVSVEGHSDKKLWLHLSVARPETMPDYWDLESAKRDFCGPERVALHIFPADSKKFNWHPNCLHLWCCLDGHPLPEFSEPAIPGDRTL